MTEGVGIPIWIESLLRDSTALSSFFADMETRIVKASHDVVSLFEKGDEDGKAKLRAGEAVAYQRLLSSVTSYQREAQQQAEFKQQTGQGG